MSMEYKEGRAALVALPEAAGTDAARGRVIAGYASHFEADEPDTYGDIVGRSAYDASLQVRPDVPILRMHAAERPIGKTTFLAPDQYGLLFRGELVNTPDADEMLELIKAGLMQVSIGYRATKSHTAVWKGKQVRMLDTIDLFEISPVTFAADSGTSVSMSKAAILERLAEAEYRILGDAAPLETKRLALLAEVNRFLESEDDNAPSLEQRRRMLDAEIASVQADMERERARL
ncbi:MAG: HK97 family phage prohead protease [Opitutaceae bacterium]|jgi:hypothetical protein